MAPLSLGDHNWLVIMIRRSSVGSALIKYEPIVSTSCVGLLGTVAGYRDMMRLAAGGTFESGLYRMHSAASSPPTLVALSSASLW